MPGDKNHYEKKEIWDNLLKDEAEKERIEEIKKIIPEDVKTILDAGCGNGAFLNSLSDKYEKMVGLDSSQIALQFVKAEKILGNVSNLPFRDESFDLVTSLEVLEHLPKADFKTALKEMERTSKKYIIVTVPNNEDLIQSFITCPRCKHRFHSFLHVRTFDKKKMKSLFFGFRAKEIKEIGPVICYYPSFFVKIYRILRPTFSDYSVCPKCGYQGREERTITKGKEKSLFLTKILIKKFLARKRKRWLLALYRKK